jgi:hypothetical protein
MRVKTFLAGIVVMLTFVTAVAQAKAAPETLHVILVGDTLDSSIGTSVAAGIVL